jgi:hypothetical protein
VRAVAKNLLDVVVLLRPRYRLRRLRRRLASAAVYRSLNTLADMHYPADDTRKPRHVLNELERLFKNKRHEQLRILELGVDSGPSLLVWRDYFPRAIIVGIDAGPMPERLRRRDVEVVRGYQDDPEPLALACKLSGGAFDLIIDDCAHIGHIAKRSFAQLFVPHLVPGGVYLIEDIGTSFWLGAFADALPFEAPALMSAMGSIDFPSHTNGMLGVAKQLVDHLMSDVIDGPRSLPTERITFLSNAAFVHKSAYRPCL